MVRFCFFFFKQKTADEMRISDWSSDVCSSDLSTRRVGTAWPVGASRGGHGPVKAYQAASDCPVASIGLFEKDLTATRHKQFFERDGIEIGFDTIRSEERRVGKEGVSTCRSRGSPDP